MRYARKVDDNQEDIVHALRVRGYSVAVTSKLGNGFPDIVVGTRGVNMMMEVKDPLKPPSARALTAAERKFCTYWNGQYDVVCTLNDALAVIKRCIERLPLG